MTSISGSSSAALQAQKLLQQLFIDAKKSKDKDVDNSSASSSSAAVSFLSQTASASGTQSASALPKPDLSQVFAKIDSDGNGSISKEELTSAVGKLGSNTKSALLSEQEKATAINDLFSQADTDGDGNISSEEFTSLADSVKPQGPPPGGGPRGPGGPPPSDDADVSSDDSIEQLFASLDTDKDGTVSMAELTSAFNTQSTDSTNDDSSTSVSSSADTKISQNVNSFLKLLAGQLNASKQSEQSTSSFYV